MARHKSSCGGFFTQVFTESVLLSKFLLVALLLTFENGGVQCFANGLHNLRSTRSKANENSNYLSTTRKNYSLAGGSAQNGPSPFGRQQGTVKIQRRMASATSISAQDESDDNQKEVLSLRGGDSTVVVADVHEVRAWPCGDDLDKKLIKIALPCIANFAINPLVGAVDLFWINRMGSTLAVAGQAAANQIFSSAFWLTSFLPSVTATLVAREYAMGNEEGVQEATSQALILGTLVAIIGSVLILSRPEQMLSSVLKSGAPAREFARPYLMIRGFGFLPSLYSLIGFSAFRGTMNTMTPLKISLFANVLNAVVDPLLIFNAKMGVSGAALATLISEICSAALFTTLMWKKKLISASKLFRMPKLEKLMPLLKGGAALQLRNFALNLTFLAVTRVTQSIDDTGVAAAAHAMAIQTFQIGGIVLLALSTVASFVVPSDMIEKVDEKTGEKSGGLRTARATTNRLMMWGLILGTVLGSLQILIIPKLLQASPLEEVRTAAKVPAILASVYQCFNGLVFIGEGVMVGTGSFMQLSISTLIATAGTLLALKELPTRFGLTGVWMSFGVFNVLRLAGVAVHQLVNGPLSRRTIVRVEAKAHAERVAVEEVARIEAARIEADDTTRRESEDGDENGGQTGSKYYF